MLASLMTVVSLVGLQPAAAAPDARSFAGTWKGTMNDLPGIDLTIEESAAKISGNVIFYFQKRADVNSPWNVTADRANPLLNPHVNGRILTFEVEHHVCDGCAELGPNLTFRMELFGANEARITRLEEDGTEAGPRVKLVRSSQASPQVAPPLQTGISVQMPITTSASPVPEADQPDALIVTVTVDGKTYLGIHPIDSEALAARLRETKGAGKRLYIKADSRAPYATVVHALDAASEAGIETSVLLTTQHNPPHPGAVVSPNGIMVETGGCHCVARAKLSL
jgi:biopolymer transport protein ExbD